VARRKIRARRRFHCDRPLLLAARRQHGMRSRSCRSGLPPRVSPHRSRGSAHDASIDLRMVASASWSDSDRVGAPPPVRQLVPPAVVNPRAIVRRSPNRSNDVQDSSGEWLGVHLGVTTCYKLRRSSTEAAFQPIRGFYCRTKKSDTCGASSAAYELLVAGSIPTPST
jgi:hypothetical protein